MRLCRMARTYALSIWLTLMQWTTRGLLAAGALFVAFFLCAIVYGLATGHGFQDSVRMAFLLTALLLATPFSLLGTGKLPYIDL